MTDEDLERLADAESDSELRIALRTLQGDLPDQEHVVKIARRVASVTGVSTALLVPNAAPDPALVAKSLETERALLPSMSIGRTAKRKLSVKVALAAVAFVAAAAAAVSSLRYRHSHGNAQPSSQAPLSRIGHEQAPPGVTLEKPKQPEHAPAQSAVKPEALAPNNSVPSSQAAPAARAHEPEHTPPSAQRTNESSHEARLPMAPSVRPQRARKQPGARGPEHSDYVSGSGVPSTGTTDELMLLRLAQDALQVSPARAQKLAEQHRREFPHSSVAQERDMIEISALVRLGQTAAARARAAQFRRLYPHSPYERQLQTMLPGP